MNLLVSGGALILASVLFAAVDLSMFRQATVNNLSTQAQIISASSVSALVFSDTRAATGTLSALAAAPDILSARIYTSAGEPFADFRRDPARAFPPVPPIPDTAPETQSVSLASVIVARRITLEGAPLGFVVVEGNLAVVYARIRNSLLITATVLGTSLLATFFLSRFAQRAVSRPIVQLSALTRQVSTENNYALRAQIADTDANELAELGDAFNGMVSGIEARERWLEEARDELEERVRERTEELQLLNKELEAFSYSVSHDLRAPLRHVAGFANLLDQDAGQVLDERGRRYVRTIVEAAGRMGRLIDDLLAFSRIGRAVTARQRLALAPLIEDVRTEVMADAAGRSVEWAIGPLPWVDADPALLRAALVNLLSNALKYSGTRQMARIEVGEAPSESGSEVVIFVRDNGVGFDMEYAHKLFGVFQRLHAGNEFTGTGIGLANVRRIIQRHGGRTWATGAVDEGATFYFSLPTVSASPQ